MTDHPDYSPYGVWMEGYTYCVEYVYPIVAVNGDPSETMLASSMGMAPMSFTAGQKICLYGVWVQVVSVETVAETAEDEDGRTVTFYTVEVGSDLDQKET